MERESFGCHARSLYSDAKREPSTQLYFFGHTVCYRRATPASSAGGHACPCPMGADSHDLPSGFSVVSDSIRRDREALFGATRADVPTIADGDDSSDGSDVEVPVFFTTTGTDAETDAEGFGGPLPPGLLSPKPLDFASSAGRNRTERLGEDFRGRTDRDRDRAEHAHTLFSSATADDDAAALAAFELAAEQALRVEEARSNELVRAHLHEARGERLDVTDDESEPSRSSDAPSDEAESSSDDDTSVRARRRPPPMPSGRRSVDTRLISAGGARGDRARETGSAGDDAFRGWLSGAAGRLAREEKKETNGERDERRDREAREAAARGKHSTRVVEEDAERSDALERFETRALETAFAAQTAESRGALDANENASVHAPPGTSLDLGSALGGLDLDGLLHRLEAPGGEAVVARVMRLNESREGGVRLDASSGDEKASSDGETVGETGDGGVVAASRRRDVEGWVLSNAKGRPRTARPARDENARRARERAGAEGGPRRGDLDPYGRGTRRGRRGARPQSASPIATPPTRTAPPAARSEEPETFETFETFTFPPPRAGTVRINAWDTMDASFADRQKEESADEKKTDPNVSSPSARLAESASRRAADASRAAREAAVRASLEADARELAARVRAAEAAATRAEAEDRENAQRRMEKTFTPAFPAVPAAPASDSALAAAETLRAEGVDAFRRGDVRASVSKFTEALARVPDDVSALANRSAAHARLGEWPSAERDASACLALDAKHEKALHRRAKARTALEDHQGALCDLEALAALLPNHAETANALARARRAAERAAGGAGEGAARAAARMEEREAARRRAEEEEAARWEARRLAGVHAHMERAKAAVRARRK